MKDHVEAICRVGALEDAIARFIRAERAEKAALETWVLADGSLGMPRPAPPEHMAIREAWQTALAEREAAHAVLEAVAKDHEERSKRYGG